MDRGSGYHAVEERPNKEQAMVDAFAAGFAEGCLRAAYDRGIVYYTLGAIRFTDLISLYNICGRRITAARSFELCERVYPEAKAAAEQLKQTQLVGFDLDVLYGDIYDCDLRLIPRDNHALVLFLDLTEVLHPRDEQFFREWVGGRSLVPGDVVYITSCIHPWVTAREKFRRLVGPILERSGVSTDQGGPLNYVPALINHFASRWGHNNYSATTFHHFFERVYRNTRFHMALNGFVLR
jgi:hypothetical protein